MPDTNDHSQLIELAVVGDRAALERLLLDHYKSLAQLISSRLPESIRSTVGVDDIVQQTYARVFQGITRYVPCDTATFLAWLASIAENLIRDALRSQQRKKRGGGFYRLEAFVSSDGEQVTDLIDLLIGDENTPSRLLARDEAVQAIQIALAGLSEEYREAIELHYFEGLTLEETAARMNRTPGSVRGLLQRAKKKMAEALVRASLYLSTK